MLYNETSQVPAVAGIYALHCPKTKKITYIGKSINIRHRYAQHLRGESNTTPKALWVKSLEDKGLKPFVSILEETHNLDEAEKKHIKAIGVVGLFNVHMGGEWKGRQDPKPWRVAGVSYPTKLYSLRCKNIGVNREWLKEFSALVKQETTTEGRLMLELRSAEALSTTSLAPKVEKWLRVVLPRIESQFPDILKA